MILGAGLAGLTLGEDLVRRGREVVVLEKLDQVGGLARTVRHKGFGFDLGGHRFHSKSCPPLDWLRSLMGEELLSVPRKSKILHEGHFINYPLELKDALSQFGFSRAFGAGVSYFWNRCSSSRTWAAQNFENKIVSRFGRQLYDVYFRPYTEKVWGMACRDLSAEWANERIAIPTLGKAIARSFSSRGAAKSRSGTKFMYPVHGIGSVSERLAERINASGRSRVVTAVGSIKLSTTSEGAEVRLACDHKEETVPCERIVSSIPLHELMKTICDDAEAEKTAVSNLSYRDLICVFITLRRKSMTDNTWIYTPDHEIIFGRLHEPGNWSSQLVPTDDMCSVCAEVFCTAGDEVWSLPDEEIQRRVIDDLVGTGLARQNDVADIWIERVKWAYPIFQCGYEKPLRDFTEAVGRRPRLHLLGRTGSFRYLNMDAVISDALEKSQYLSELPAEAVNTQLCQNPRP